MERKQLLLLLFFGFSVALFIAGAVMLGIGISKNSDSDSHSKEPSSTGESSAIFTSTQLQGLQWNDDLAKPDSDAFKTAAKDVAAKLLAALQPSRRRRSVFQLDSEAPVPSNVVVNKFTKDPAGGTDAYTTMIFPTPAVDGHTIAKEMGNAGYSTGVYSDPLDQCNGQPFAPPAGPVTTVAPYTGPTTAQPVTTPPPATTVCFTAYPTNYPTPSDRPLPEGANCDVTGHNTATMFVVDIATPTSGTLEDKLAKIREFLYEVPTTVGLPSTGTWKGVTHYLIPYVGQQAFIVGDKPCNDAVCWKAAVDQLVPKINDGKSNVHDLATPLQYIINQIQSTIPYGTARNVIIITDGYDLNAQKPATEFAAPLKDDKFTIATIVVTPAIVVQKAHKPVVSDGNHFYTVDSYDWLNNPAVKSTTATWICNAFYPTPPPVTAGPTPYPLVVTTPTSTQAPPVTPQPPIRPGDCILDVLYLIDESQSMLDYGYTQSIDLVRQLTQTLSQMKAASRFAIVTFNSNLVYSSFSYLDAPTFLAKLEQIPVRTGATHFEVGFDAARQIISNYARHNNDDVRPMLIFLSDGWNGNETVTDKVTDVTHDLRANYATEIIAFGVNETAHGKALTEQAIGVDAIDSYVQSWYFDMPMANLPLAVNETVMSIQCKNAESCALDLTFVIEVSEVEQDTNVQVQKQAVINTIAHYEQYVGPYKAKLSLVFFSAPDHLQNVEVDRSGVLYSQMDDVSSAVSVLNSTNFILGGASDLKLAMQLTKQTLDQDASGNENLVIVMARGTFRDGNSTNCCDDPQTAAAAVRQMATMQGVVIGGFPDKQILDSVTQSNSIDGNALLVKGDVAASAKSISDSLRPIVEAKRKWARCAALADRVPQCEQYVDVILIVHAQNKTDWDTITTFAADEFIPGLIGNGTVPLGENDYVNIAVISYSASSATTVLDFNAKKSPADIAAAVGKAAFVDGHTNTPQLSKAYHQAGTVMQHGRALASKIVIVISDYIDKADISSAQTEKGRLPRSFVYGVHAGEEKSPADQDVALHSLSMLDVKSKRSARNYANMFNKAVCRYVPPVVPSTPAPVTDMPPTPSPAPKVHQQAEWPDVTLLIDTSVQADGSGMSDKGFQQIREFLSNTFLNRLVLGRSHSRVAVATFDRTANVVCRLNDTRSYYDVADCLGPKLKFALDGSHSATRDLKGALDSLRSSVYTPAGDWRPLRENFLFILTTGVSSTDASQSLNLIQHMGVRTMGVSLGDRIPSEQLSLYGADSISVPNWQDGAYGILADSNPLEQQLFSYATAKHWVQLSRMFANFHFVVDSSMMAANGFGQVQQFIRQFVGQLSLSPLTASVSIVPYADGVTVTLPPTNDKYAVKQFLSSTWTYSNPASNEANIGDAIQTVAGFNATTDRANYVIYIVQAASVTGIEKTSLLNRMIPLVLSANDIVKYGKQLAPNSTHVYTVHSPSKLLNWVQADSVKAPNAMTRFFSDITDLQESYEAALPHLALPQIRGDIAIAFDQTGLTKDTFKQAKQYLLTTLSRLNIGEHGVRVALQAFSGRLIVEGGWHFSDALTMDDVRTRLDSLRYEQDVFSTTKADLPYALSEMNNYMLQRERGWREGPTYVFILATAEQFFNDADAVAEAKKVFLKAKTVALGTTGVMYPEVRQFVSSYYSTVASPSDLLPSAPQSLALYHTIADLYQAWKFPTLPDISAVKADYVFLLDHNSRAAKFQMIKKFLIQFVINAGGNTFMEGNRVAILSYDATGVLPFDSFSLSDFSDQTGLESAIHAITFQKNRDNSDLRAALTYLTASPSSFGARATNPLYLIGFFASSDIAAPLSSQLTRKLADTTSTWAFQSASDARLPYMDSFLGNTGLDHISETDNYNVNDASYPAFQQYLVKEYYDFVQTYGQ